MYEIFFSLLIIHHIIALNLLILLLLHIMMDSLFILPKNKQNIILFYLYKNTL